MSARPLYKHGSMPGEALHSESWNTKDLRLAEWTFKNDTQSLSFRRTILINKQCWKSASPSYLLHTHTLGTGSITCLCFYRSATATERKIIYSWTSEQFKTYHWQCKRSTHQTSCIWIALQATLYCFRIQIVLGCSSKKKEKGWAATAWLWLIHERERSVHCSSLFSKSI